MSVASPCTGVCRIDPHSSLCSGCRRTRDEIAGWLGYSPQQRRAVMRDLRGRKL